MLKHNLRTTFRLKSQFSKICTNNRNLTKTRYYLFIQAGFDIHVRQLMLYNNHFYRRGEVTFKKKIEFLYPYREMWLVNENNSKNLHVGAFIFLLALLYRSVLVFARSYKYIFISWFNEHAPLLFSSIIQLFKIKELFAIFKFLRFVVLLKNLQYYEDTNICFQIKTFLFD